MLYPDLISLNEHLYMSVRACLCACVCVRVMNTLNTVGASTC